MQNSKFSGLRLSCRELEIVPKDNLSINVNIAATLIVGLRMIFEKYRGGEKKSSLDSWTVLQDFLSDRAQNWRPVRGLVKHLPVMFLRESELSAHRTTGISESTTFQNLDILHVPALSTVRDYHKR